MLKKTVYFRTQDDLDKFNAIKNKAEWLHEHLNFALETIATTSTIVDDKTVSVKIGKIVRTNFSGTAKEQLCKHFQPKGQCTQKNCK